jgi:hypothetical protein
VKNKYDVKIGVRAAQYSRCINNSRKIRNSAASQGKKKSCANKQRLLNELAAALLEGNVVARGE